MSNAFFDRPIVSTPYEYPRQHWELDGTGQPTGNLVPTRHKADFITTIPKPKKTQERGPDGTGTRPAQGALNRQAEVRLTSIIKALAAWQALPPPHQREDVKWITEAKTDATRTRTRRLETADAWIAEGKEHNWRY